MALQILRLTLRAQFLAWYRVNLTLQSSMRFWRLRLFTYGGLTLKTDRILMCWRGIFEPRHLLHYGKHCQELVKTGNPWH